MHVIPQKKLTHANWSQKENEWDRKWVDTRQKTLVDQEVHFLLALYTFSSFLFSLLFFSWIEFQKTSKEQACLLVENL